MTGGYFVGRGERLRWAHEVRYSPDPTLVRRHAGGRVVARCDSLEQAERIAAALNAVGETDP